MKRTILTLAAALGVFGAGLGVEQAGLLDPPAAAAQTVAQAPAAVAPAAAPQCPAEAPQGLSGPATPPAPAQAPTPAPAPAREGLVNLNTATAAELDALPDIGKARIGRILAARPIRSIDDLAGPGMPASVIAMLKARATV